MAKIKKPDDGYEQIHSLVMAEDGLSWECSCGQKGQNEFHKTHDSDSLFNHLLDDGPQYWGYQLNVADKRLYEVEGKGGSGTGDNPSLFC